MKLVHIYIWLLYNHSVKLFWVQLYIYYTEYCTTTVRLYTTYLLYTPTARNYYEHNYCNSIWHNH